jgi:hypothetical protein
LEVYAASEAPGYLQARIASFIGYWTGILPLSFADLRLHVPISETISDEPEVVAAIKVYNNQLESSIQEDIKLTSGIKSDVNRPEDSDDEDSDDEDQAGVVDPAVDDLRGGIFREGNDVRSMLIRYFCEAIIDAAQREGFVDRKGRDLAHKGYNVQGIVHRRLPDDVDPHALAGASSIQLFLSHTETLLLPFVTNALRKVPLGLKSLGGVMDHLVNRGHKSAPFVEGLTVELLPFQLQSLQWALDRESVEGGIQSYFNAKIPRSDDEGDWFYNPITGKLSTAKPKLVRGGIIAEQMVSFGGRTDFI